MFPTNFENWPPLLLRLMHARSEVGLRCHVIVQLWCEALLRFAFPSSSDARVRLVSAVFGYLVHGAMQICFSFVQEADPSRYRHDSKVSLKRYLHRHGQCQTSGTKRLQFVTSPILPFHGG